MSPIDLCQSQFLRIGAAYEGQGVLDITGVPDGVKTKLQHVHRVYFKATLVIHPDKVDANVREEAENAIKALF